MMVHWDVTQSDPLPNDKTTPSMQPYSAGCGFSRELARENRRRGE